MGTKATKLSLLQLEFGESACEISWQMTVWQINRTANSEQYKVQ